MVLTHLILNDMIKVKGQISDMAVCIIDADYRISGLAKLFFTELSQKVCLVISFIMSKTYQVTFLRKKILKD